MNGTAHFADRLLEVEVVALPLGNVPKKEVSKFFRVIQDEAVVSDFF